MTIKRIFSISLFFLTILSFNVLAQQVENSFNLIKIKPQLGDLHYQVFRCTSEEKQRWDKLELVVQGHAVATEKTLLVELNNIGAGGYCVRVYQDTNGNQQLDFGSGNIPLEPVGFSSNPNLMLGYPAPKKTFIELPSNKLIKIKMNYRRKA